MFPQPSQDDRTQAQLLQELRSGTPQVQEEALTRLAAVGEAEALDAVVDYLLSQPPGSSNAGLDALRVLAGKYLPADRYGLAEVTIPYLASEDWSKRLGATRLLGSHPNELATDALRDLIDEARHKALEERRSRFSAVRVMVERTLAEAILAMAACGRLMAQHDVYDLMEERAFRSLATRALGIIGSETDRYQLEDLAEDEDARVRDAAQWSLSLMDERAEQFMRPPDQVPAPPPARLTPIYWAHRQLWASEDDLIQFLVVRVGIEHLMLDGLLADGRVPDECTITLRKYAGNQPPEYRFNTAPVVGMWKYYASGPVLEEIENPEPTMPVPPATRSNLPMPRVSHMTISYPAALDEGSDEALVSFDCVFEPFLGRGWMYRITQRSDGWGFTVLRRTWTG